MTATLTQRQADCLAFIKDYVAAHDGVGPSFQEIMDGMGLSSKSGVHRLMNALQTRGHVRYLFGRRRSIELVDHRPMALASLIHGSSRDDLVQIRQIIDAQIEALAA